MTSPRDRYKYPWRSDNKTFMNLQWRLRRSSLGIEVWRICCERHSLNMNVEKMTGQSTATLHPTPMDTSEQKENGGEVTLSRSTPAFTFAPSIRRRLSKGALDSPYLSRPRMKRRGAVSYDRCDAAAEYIRYLGTH